MNIFCIFFNTLHCYMFRKSIKFAFVYLNIYIKIYNKFSIYKK